MKQLQLLLVLLLLQTSSNAQVNSTSDKKDADKYLTDLLKSDSLFNQSSDNLQKCQIKDKLGIYYYAINYEKSITYFKAAADCYKTNNNRLEANCYLNIAAIYDEQLGQNKPAIAALYQSLEAAERHKDTLHQATVLKYIGALKGREKDFGGGKIVVKRAIKLFESKNFEQDVAVCYYDLGEVYFYENKLDSCIFSLQTAKKMQTNFNNLGRVFGINNFLIKTYLKQKDFKKLEEINKENEGNIGNTKVDDFIRKVYYKTIVEYYDLTKNTTKKEDCLNKLAELEKK